MSSPEDQARQASTGRALARVGTSPQGGGQLQKRLVEAAEKVERVLSETHDAYARLEAQDQRLLPLQGMLDSHCDSFSSNRLDKFRKFIVDLRAQHNKVGISSVTPIAESYSEASDQVSKEATAVGNGVAHRPTSPLPKAQASEQASDTSRRYDPALRLELIGSIEVLEQEMAQLTDLAACGEQAAGQVAGVRRSLERLWDDVGGVRLQALEDQKRPLTASPLDDSIPSSELRGMVAALQKEVVQLVGRCDQCDDEAAVSKQEMSRVREAVIALYRSSQTAPEPSSLAEDITTLRRDFAALRSEMDGQAQDLKKEWAQLLDQGIEARQEQSSPRQELSPGRSEALADEVQRLRQQLFEAIQDIRQLAVRCDRAAEEAAGARHDVDAVREQTGRGRLLPSSTHGALPESTMSELRQYVDRSTLNREELSNEFTKLRRELRGLESQTQRPRQDAGEMEVEIADVARREFESLMLQRKSKEPSGEGSLLEELKMLEEKIDKHAIALEEVNTMKTEVGSLVDNINIMKARMSDSDTNSKEKLENVEQEIRGLRHRFETGDVRDAVAEVRANPLRLTTGSVKTLISEDVSTRASTTQEEPITRKELKDAAYTEVAQALQLMMEPMVKDIAEMQKEIAEVTQRLDSDVNKIVENMQVLKLKNGSLAGELKDQMSKCEQRVCGLTEDLRAAIDEVSEGVGSPSSPSFQAAQFEEFREAAMKAHAFLVDKMEGLEEVFEVKLRDAGIDFTNTKTFFTSDLQSLKGELQCLKDDIQRNRSKIDTLEEEAPAVASPYMQVPRNEQASSVTPKDLRNECDLVRQEMLMLKDELRGELPFQQRSEGAALAVNEDMADVIMTLKRDLAAVRDQASLGAKVEQDISEVNEQLRKELADLRLAASQGGSNFAAEATLDELRRDIEKIRTDECSQIRDDVNELTARMITDRSMVQASVAAAMSLAEKTSPDKVSSSILPLLAGGVGPTGTTEPFRLRVTMVNAKGLKTKLGGEAVSPLCTCTCSDKRYESEVVENSSDPEWRFSFETQSYQFGSPLEFAVWDQTVDGKLVGNVRLDAKKFFPDGFQGPLPLLEAGATTRRRSREGWRNSSASNMMQLVVQVELLGKPQLNTEPENGQWTYVVSASEGVSLRRSLRFEKDERVDRRLAEGEIVVVSQRLRASGATIFRVNSQAAPQQPLWAISLDSQTGANSSSSSGLPSMVEAVVENGLWSAVIAAPEGDEGVRAMSRMSMATFRVDIEEETPIPAGTTVQVQQCVRIGGTCFLRLLTPSVSDDQRWLTDVRGDEVLVDKIHDLLGSTIEVSVREDASDLGMTLRNSSPGGLSIVLVSSVAEDGWARRNSIATGAAIIELNGQKVAFMETEVFHQLSLKRPLHLKVRLPSEGSMVQLP